MLAVLVRRSSRREIPVGQPSANRGIRREVILSNLLQDRIFHVAIFRICPGTNSAIVAGFPPHTGSVAVAQGKLLVVPGRSSIDAGDVAL